MHKFRKLIFGIKLYTFRTVLLYIIRSFSLYTQQCYMSYRFCWQLPSRIRAERPDPASKLSANLYDIQHCCVYSKKKKTPDDGQRDCPKDVEFYSKNKFEKLVHLVGLFIRMFQLTTRSRIKSEQSNNDSIQLFTLVLTEQPNGQHKLSTNTYVKHSHKNSKWQKESYKKGTLVKKW